MESPKNRRGFWTKILILLFVVATAYLIMTYHNQSQKNDDLQQQISDLKNKNHTLTMSAKRQDELSAEQLILKQDELESDIKVAGDSLKQSVITNDHIVTLVQVAKEAGVRLVGVSSSELKTDTIETIPFDIMRLRVQAEGNRSNATDFVSQICEAFQTSIIHNTGIQIREEDTGEILLLSLDIDIYSHRDQ